MTDDKKTFWAKIAIAIPTVSLILGALAQASGPATWVWDHLSILLARQSTQSAVAAAGLALLAAGWLPHIIPARLPRGWTKWLTRCACLLVAWPVYIVLMNPRSGVEKQSAMLIGLLLGGSTMTLWSACSDTLYKAWPAIKPGSLE